MRTPTFFRTDPTSIRRRQVAAELAEQRQDQHRAQATLHTRWV